jgi:hypothetical protein
MELPASIGTRLQYGSVDGGQAAELLHAHLRRLGLDLTLSALAVLWAN